MSIISNFELKTGLKPTQAAKLLGLQYQRYNEFKNGTRQLKPYHVASINAHLALSQEQRKELPEVL